MFSVARMRATVLKSECVSSWLSGSSCPVLFRKIYRPHGKTQRLQPDVSLERPRVWQRCRRPSRNRRRLRYGYHLSLSKASGRWPSVGLISRSIWRSITSLRNSL